MSPANAIDAVTHPDPYPYYATLRQGPPLAFDDTLQLWVASRADVVAEVLEHPALRVRPVTEPVPRGIAGGPAGEVFGRLVRMNDGALHAVHRRMLQKALAGLDPEGTRNEVLRVARRLPGGPLDEWMFAMPLRALAHLLGFNGEDGPGIVADARAFSACLSPLSTREQFDAADTAALSLGDRLRRLLAGRRARPDSLLAAVLAQAHEDASVNADTLLANLVGLFSQTCDSTAGLIGQAVVALAREAGLATQVGTRVDGFELLMQEVARHDPPVQNTRRFVADACTVAGIALRPGDALLVVLAAANRDPALNAEPDALRLERVARRNLGFGRGVHACPGQALAQTFAACGVQALIEQGIDLNSIRTSGWNYRVSVNGRIPCFGASVVAAR
ncbi:cytochrome P450 [Variovorax sp. dw_954]|uniref:cytochrome P450 n=1 Tax=Variovorax sp. dw_954 TaxID=2720078 RepID=UPI001BD6A6EC|nr:cytochrome P450 [Variovorax sp. dw_954]